MAQIQGEGFEIDTIERKQEIGTDGYNIRVKPVTTAPKKPNEAQGRDTFETPNYAVDLLLPFIPKNVKLIWECASGGGKIANVLKKANYAVIDTDLRGTLYYWKFNFVTDSLATLREVYGIENKIDCIITNPPFSIKDLFIERAFKYNLPFAFLINADYSQQTINWIRRGCQKIVPTSRIAYITPNIINRVNGGEGTNYKNKEEIPSKLVYKYSPSQFHSMWLTWGFDLGSSEIFVDLPLEDRKNNI